VTVTLQTTNVNFYLHIKVNLYHVMTISPVIQSWLFKCANLNLSLIYKIDMLNYNNVTALNEIHNHFSLAYIHVILMSLKCKAGVYNCPL